MGIQQPVVVAASRQGQHEHSPVIYDTVGKLHNVYLLIIFFHILKSILLTKGVRYGAAF